MTLFEKSQPGCGNQLLASLDVPTVELESAFVRQSEWTLPAMAEADLSRHYTELAEKTHGVNNGFYPLGSCTMKYNPKINEALAALPGFTEIHPLQPLESVQGCLEVLYKAEQALCEITGMDAMSFQPAAGAHGEFTGLLLIKAYHQSRQDHKRTKILVPDSAHGTNPASASMAGFTIVNIPSNDEGCVDLEALRAAADEETAGLMLTNPNTVGLFDRNILEITKIVHEAGGLNYYDGANLNAIMGIVRPGEMGFDVIHLNLHKTFSTPHGGGGPGSGPVGCKDFLIPFLPNPHAVVLEEEYSWEESLHSIGRVRAFYGNFLVVVKALAYILTLGKEGIPEAAANAVLNANYMLTKLKDLYPPAYDGLCMHEFVLSLEKLKKEKGVSAMDIAKSLLDYGIHPPTMYFPLIVPEALMVEPTETESKQTLDEAVEAFRTIYATAISEPEQLHAAPQSTVIGRPDEVQAARSPIVRWRPEHQ